MSTYTLNRHMRVGRLAIYNLAVQVVTSITMIIWSWLSPSVWALVGGTVVSSIVSLIWSYRLQPGLKHRFEWEPDAARSLLSFGKWIFFSTAVMFLATQADRLIMGKLVTFELLGIYTVALTLATLPQQVLASVSSQVILPAITKMTDLERPALRANLARHRKVILLVAAIALSLLITWGDYVIGGLYDKRYIQATWMLPILALGIWPNLLFETLRQALTAIGKPNYEAIGQASKAAYICIGIPIGFHTLGILGVILVIALNDLPLYSVVIYGLYREKLSCIGQDIRMTGLLIGILGLSLVSRYALGGGLPIHSLLQP